MDDQTKIMLKPTKFLPFGFAALCGLLCFAAAAQQPSAATPVAQSVTVTTTIEPIPLSESDRSVQTLDTRQYPLLFNSVVDYLSLDSSLNLQSRAPAGVQSDLSIRGTTFEQSLILLNGLRIDDPETGHLNLDIPVPLDAISRIEVLHGSGSTFYGSDAIGGAVNLITAEPVAPLTGSPFSLTAKAGGGNYSSTEQSFRADYATKPFSAELSGSRDTSGGFIADRNYASNAISAETWLNLRPGTTDILVAASDRPYGANQFYGPYPSWERTKGWFASIQQQLGTRTAASFAYRRHTDMFVLFVNDPSIYENNHADTAWQSALRRVDHLSTNVTLSYGLEANGDAILSTNLGRHARNQGAGYANLSLPSLGRFSLSIGAREEIFSGGDAIFSPNAAVAFTLTRTVRLRASAGHGFRLPTYLDLYYSDPTNIGNPNLKPESSWSYEGGVDWTPASGRFTLKTTGFSLHQKDGIDYSKYSLSAPWQATNVGNFNYNGAETQLRLRLSGNQHVDLSYTAVSATSPPKGLISEYAFNYAAQNAVFAWTGVFHQLTAHTQVGVTQKTGRTAYPVWDISLARNTGLVRPYVRLMNLSNTGYQDIPGVPVQGRTIMAGTAFSWPRR
ncbi:MAG: TonB-dependent receptor [Edaphobacter sp.]